jgi:hypothetical protein
VAGSYVLDTATSVLVNNVVPGSQVTLFVNDEPRGAPVDSIEAETGPPTGTPSRIQVSLPVGWPPLAAGDVLTAGQALCGLNRIPPAKGNSVPVLAPVAAPPPGTGGTTGGLTSDSNYLMYTPGASGGCENLLKVSVTIDVTEEIQFESASGGTVQGFGFQLNCYSPVEEYCAVQQYIIALQGTELTGLINTWPVIGGPIIAPPDNSYPVFTIGLPSVSLPVGYQMKITLGNDMAGNVVNVAWAVNGMTVASQNIPNLLTSLGLQATYVAPIVVFEMNLVGPGGGEGAELSSGAGTFTYSASSPLTVSSGYPACVEDAASTEETANTFYGALPANPGNPFNQSFTVDPAQPAILKLRGPRDRSVRPPLE